MVGTRRRNNYPLHIVACSMVAAVGLILSACGSGTAQGGGSNVGKSASIPASYPDNYQSIINAASKEGGSLSIYSSSPQEVWAPVFKAFKERYPFVKNIKNLNTSQAAVYERAASDASTETGTTDIFQIQTSTGEKFLAHKELLAKYKSPETDAVPKNLKLAVPYIYDYAASPQVVAYNSALIDEDLQSLADVEKLLKSSPDESLTPTVRSLDSAWAFATYYTLLDNVPSLWSTFANIVPSAKPEDSTGSMLTKLGQGEYAIAIFADASSTSSAVKNSGGVIKAFAPTDGTVFQPYGVGIAAHAPHPNTAKLFVDFVLSKSGQQAVLNGGLSAYRDGLEAPPGVFTYAQVLSKIGKDNAFITDYASPSQSDAQAFKERWNHLAS